MADLKTNYVDDVLDAEKNQLRKYQMITNDDGTVSFVDATDYLTQGTNFGAKDINDTNGAVNELNNSLGELKREKWYQQRMANTNVVNGVVDNNRRLLNEDGTLFSLANNANSTYKVTMVSRTSSSNTLYCSESIVDFSTGGVGICIMSKTDSVYPYLSVTAENNIITTITPSNYSLSCHVTIEKLR